MESKIFSDIHTHTTYSHGKGSIMDNARFAHEYGLKTLGIADHGPGHMNYGLKMSEIDNMRKDIAEAKAAYPELEILLGVEANIVNYSGNLDVSKEEQALFDYIIAGYHYGYFGEQPVHGLVVCVGGWLSDHGLPSSAGQRARNTELVISALEENEIKILTHPGDKMPVNIDAIARVCERRHTMLEINDKHTHLTAEEIKAVQKYNVEFWLSSDAHRSENVGRIEGALKRAEESGLDLSRIVNLRR